MSNQTDLEALRALEADGSDLEHVEELHERFNVFESIGFIKQEAMHSHFLAFLLDPRQNHGLGDLFLKRFLQEIPEFDISTNAPNLAETTV